MPRRDAEQAVVDAMRRDGEMLSLSFERGEPVWRLSHSHRRVSSRTAQRIIARTDVRASGDALFAETPAQTYRVR
jgi:hypothetical protein